MALFAGVSVALLGVTALTGWLLHNEALKTIIPGSNFPIRPNVATGLLFCGVTLALLSRRTLTNPIRVCAGAIAAAITILSALTVGEYAGGWDFGIERWLMEEAPAVLAISHSGRMSPISALSFVLVGVALFAASRRLQKRLRLPLVGGLGGALMVGGGTPLAGFFLEMLFGPRWNYMGTDASGLAGAIGFFLLGVGLLALLRGNAILTWSLGRWTTAGFASGLALMILAAGLTYNFTVKMQQTATQVGHMQEILKQLEEIENNLADLERDQRSYIITADERLLEGWDVKQSEVRDHFGKLQKLQADNSHRQPLLRQLAALVSKRIDWAKQTIKARRDLGFPAAQEMVATGLGVALLEQSRGLIKAIDDDENARLLESQAQSDLASQTAFLMLPLGVFLCFVILSLVVSFLNSGMDQRGQAEHSLRQSEEGMRAILDSALDCIITMDHHGRVMEFNPAAEKTFGYRREEAVGQLLSELIIPPSLREQHQRGLARYLATGEAPVLGQRLELSAVRRDGSEFPIELAIIRIGKQEPPMFTGFIRDITERKLAEEVVVESERRLRFLNDLGDATRSLSQPKEIMATVARLLGTHLHASRCAYVEVNKDGDGFTVPGDYTDGCASIVGEYRLSDFGERTHSELASGRTFVLFDVDAELPADGAVAYKAIEIKAMIACPLIRKGELLATMAVHSSTPRKWTNDEITLVKEVVERCWSIIERARAEVVLRESEEYLRLVITASNDGIWEYDFLTGLLTWSDRVYEMFGLDRCTFVPTLDSFTALLHPEDRSSFQQAVPEQMASGVRYEAHARILRGDGSYGHFLRRGRAVLDAAGKPTRMVGSFADLTSLLQAEQKLLEQAELLNLAQDAIMVRDMDDRIEFWNYGAEALYGWTAEEARGRLSGDFLHYEEPVKTLAERTLLETGAWSGECRHVTKQGAPVIVRSRWTLVRDEHGKPKSKLIIATDMTEQKKIEEQFLRAQRLESIGTLASGVAHDLNNILVPIMMAAPMLRGEMAPTEREKFLDIVETSAQRGADIIKQVLTFARGADGGDRTLLQPIFLLEEVCKIASQTFPKSIALRTFYKEDIRLLEADSTQLHQILLNLCINARDAMPNGGELCLGAENFDVDELYASTIPGATAGPHVMLEVVDTGSGIPSDVLDKIFDPFFTTKSIGQGTGLGLSTVAGIVKSHGGFIDVSSKPGRTSFKIFLPAKAPVDTAAALQVDAMVPRGNGQTILLVDDEPSICEVAEVILVSNGYKVFVAKDGPSALAIFAQKMGHIAVVVTDLAMPGMDGLMLVRTLRRIEPGLKIIVSTGRTDDSHAAEITALRVDGSLTKPYTTRNLLLKLSHVLQSSGQGGAVEQLIIDDNAHAFGWQQTATGLKVDTLIS